jgi:ABC-type branched-subunit amino acid transport system ATPase component
VITRPKLILLDEPVAEVNLKSCNHIWVLAEEINLADGTPEEI